jgi:AraC-like DNA-binding protein
MYVLSGTAHLRETALDDYPFRPLRHCSGSFAGAPAVRFPDGRFELVLDLREAGYGEGQLSTFGDQDCLVSVADIKLRQSVQVEQELLEDMLLVRATLGCAVRYRLDDAAEWRFMRPAVTVSLLPRGTRMSVDIQADVLHTTVSVLLRPSALLKRHGLSAEALPAPLLASIDQTPKKPVTLLTMPLNSDISSLLHDITRSRLTGSLRAMQVAARGVELLALVAQAWLEQGSDGIKMPARRRDAEIVIGARRALAQRFADPPTLQALAAELGTNRNKLNQLFRQTMGVTLQTYCVQRRIERAQALLMEGRLSVAQVAEAVGYQHQSSFTAAFRDVVGMCPRDYHHKAHLPAESHQAVH